MPTGEGEDPAGAAASAAETTDLLIADYALDQRRSVAYLTGTRQLAERVADETAKLGPEVARFAGSDESGFRI